MKLLRIRDVKTPERGTKESSGIDFFLPNDFTELYNCKTCIFTPSSLILEQQQQIMKDTYFLFDDEKPYISIPPWYWILIPSGIKIELWSATSEKVYDLVFTEKSGIASKLGLIIGAKVVDMDFQWETHLHLINTSIYTIPIYPWQKIVQGIIREVIIDPIIEVSEDQIHLRSSQRWTWWFGSTNK